MKAKNKEARHRSERKIAMDCTVPDSPQSAFIALFRPIRDKSWPNVACSYLFTDSEEKNTDHYQF